MPADDPRAKRVLKRYPKNEQFSDAHLDLTGISLEALGTACRCAPDKFWLPRELDDYAISCLAHWLKLEFDAGAYDYFIHSYARREACSAERVPPKDLPLPCEDGPPTRIPCDQGLRWVSARPEDGEEHYVGMPDSSLDSDSGTH